MDYKLAKELKDAGFPQYGIGKYWHNGVLETYQELEEWGENHLGVMDNSFYCPTLEELIEACGQHFYSLRYGYISGMGDIFHWVAHSHSVDAYSVSALNAAAKEGFIGKNPTEAVAMLYLALHGKKQNNKDAGETSRVEGK